ncbi:MAG: lysophospholipase [Myxococcales bacterium]|nr:lysophospholipase [Myxococcales bacterium]
MTTSPTKPPIVFVHGAWHGAWCWEAFAERFASWGYDTHCVELRSHGVRAGTSAMRWNGIGHYLQDVREVIADLEQPPIVIGHSMGGYVTQHLLAEGTVAVDRVVLLTPVPVSGAWGALWNVARLRPGRLLLTNLTLDLYHLVNTEALVRQFLFLPDTDDAVVQSTGARLVGEGYRAFLDMLLSRPRAAPGRCPMLVVGAEHDALFSSREMTATATAWGADLEMMPGMPHDVMLDPRWPEVADLIQAWLTKPSS